MRTLIVAALPEEALPLLARLGDRHPARPPRRRPTGTRPWIARGSLSGRPVAIVVTGDGERNAREGIRRALEIVAAGRLVAIGVAGGLAPDLAAGSLVVGSRVVGPGEGTLRADPSLVAAVSRGGVREGVVATTSRILDTPAARAALRARHAREAPGAGTSRAEGAGRGEPDAVTSRVGGRRPAARLPDVADLESATFATAAEGEGLPWVVLRAVSDSASERLPGYLDRCRDGGGSIRRAAVLGQALLRPWTIPALLRLRRRVRTGAARLAAAVEEMLARSDRAGPGFRTEGKDG